VVPTVFFVDDNQSLCTLFATGAPKEWDVRCFLNPLEVLNALLESKPMVIVSDFNMPEMKGDDLLAVVAAMSPNTIRIMQTGHTDESLLIESINKAHVMEYIQKPWAIADMCKRVAAAVDVYRSNEKIRKLAELTEQNEEEVRELRIQLKQATNELTIYKDHVARSQIEIENWAPAGIVWAIKQGTLPGDGARTVATMVFVVNAGILPDVIVQGRSLRSQIVQAHSDSVLRHSGWKEALGGGITAAHFGLLDSAKSISDSAMAAARELKTQLENLHRVSQLQFSCNIALDVKDDVSVRVHTSIVNTPYGMSTQKSLDVSDFNFSNFRKVVEAVKSENQNEISIFVTEEFKNRLSLLKLGFERREVALNGDQVVFFKYLGLAAEEKT
jgi:FixJ family two-component response regulator